MKSLLIKSLMLLATVAYINAASLYITNNLAASNHTVFASAKLIESITLSTTNTTADTIVRLYDGYTTYTNAEYTRPLKYSTNIVTSYITSTGVTNQMTNTSLYVTTETVAAGSGASPVVAAIVIPAGETITFTPTTSMLIANRLTLSNNLAGTTAIITYRNP